MNPTPEMIEAAREAYVKELPETALYPSEFAMGAALTAALALLPGEPKPGLPIFAEGGIGHRLLSAMEDYRRDYVFSPDEGSDHEPSEFEQSMLEDFLNGAMSDNVVNRLLQDFAKSVAAPAPQPVSVKALEWKEYDRGDGPEEWDTNDGFSGYYNIRLWTDFLLSFSDDTKQGASFQSLDEAKAAAQADYESRIRSALSPPVEGGMEKEEPFVLGYDAGLKQGEADVSITTREAIVKSLAVLKVYQRGMLPPSGDVDAAVRAIELAGLDASPFPSAEIEKGPATSDLIQALSRLAGNRHADGTSSLVSHADRTAIIDGCHDLLIASRQTTSSAEIEALREELAATYEELIDHNGDDLNDSRAKRVADLRVARSILSKLDER